jgi:hypothetical protein
VVQQVMGLAEQVVKEEQEEVGEEDGYMSVI